MFYLGTANAEGQPYIQYRGGSREFLKVIENDPELLERLRDSEYLGNAERVILFSIEAWDINCPQRIHKRFSQRQIAPVIEKLERRVRELEGELAKARQDDSR